MSAPAPEDAYRFRDLEDRLIARFSSRLRPEDVQRCLAEAAVPYQGARVTTYLHVLVERAAVVQLEAMGGPCPSRIHLASQGGAP